MTLVPGLDAIAKKVRSRLEERKKILPLNDLESGLKPKQPKNLKSLFPKDELNIIAEVKRASPSEGDIQPDADPVQIAGHYLENHAKALSILTEEDYFKGNLEFITRIRRQFPDAFLLMKDFIIDEYQILEGLRAGADAILLIVALLGKTKLEELYSRTTDLGLICLVEVHDAAEMKLATGLGCPFIGVNNRNLKTMKVDLNTSAELAKSVPGSTVLVSESGLKEGRQLAELRKLGYTAFLMGTHFMKNSNPGAALRQFIKDVHAHQD